MHRSMRGVVKIFLEGFFLVDMTILLLFQHQPLLLIHQDVSLFPGQCPCLPHDGDGTDIELFLGPTALILLHPTDILRTPHSR